MRNEIANETDLEVSDREETTALKLWHNPDAQGYMYSREAREDGLDPWTTITGVDANRDETKITLEYGRASEVIVDPDFVVYVKKGSNLFSHQEASDQYWMSNSIG